MRTPVFTGACPALVTPFNQHGAIDYDAFGRQIDAQIAAGVCADAGARGLEKAVELAGSLLAVYASLPLVSSVLDLLQDLLGG